MRRIVMSLVLLFVLEQGMQDVVLPVLVGMLYSLELQNVEEHVHLVSSGEHQIIVVNYAIQLVLAVQDLLGINANPVQLGLIW